MGLATGVPAALEDIQQSMLERATTWRDDHTVDVVDLDSAREAAATGFARVPWDAVGASGEERLAAEGVTVRCLQTPDGDVPDHAEESGLVAVVARAY